MGTELEDSLPHQGAAPSSALLGVSIGVETFDGNGNTFVSETLNAALGIFPQTLTGTYTIHPDCTGSATVNFPDGGTATASLIVVDAGSEIEFMNTWHAVVEFGIMKKQAIANGECTNATLNGTYGYVLEGFFQGYKRSPLGSTSIAASNGIETFDGNGNTFGSETVNVAGETFQQTFTGTYHVNADCTGSITRNLSNGLTTTGSLSLVDGGREIEVANRANMVIQFGSLKKQ